MEDWLKTAEVMQLCGWSHRGSVTRVVRREKWRVQKPHEFHPEDRYHRAIFKPTFGIASEQLC